MMDFNALKQSLNTLIGYEGGQLLDCMVQAVKSSTRMIMKQKQCMLLRKIKQNGIGTNDVECIWTHSGKVRRFKGFCDIEKPSCSISI